MWIWAGVIKNPECDSNNQIVGVVWMIFYSFHIIISSVVAFRGIQARTSHIFLYLNRLTPPIRIALLFCIVASTVHIGVIEDFIHRNRSYMKDNEEASWGFGQTLALLMVPVSALSVFKDLRQKIRQLKSSHNGEFSSPTCYLGTF